MAGHRSTLPNVMEIGRKLEWFSKLDRPKPHVFDGLVTALQLQEGFGLHTLNATARQNFEIDGQRNPGVILHCFLEGSTEATLAGKPMNLGRKPGEPVKLVLTSIGETQRFRRHSRPNEYVRKISIQMSHGWLEQNGLALPGHSGGSIMQRIERVAGMDELRMLEQLALSPGFSTPVARLQAEAMSLGLVARCFERFSDQPGPAGLTPREQAQLRRVEEFACQPGPLPSLQQLATESGLSLSGLRRLIQAAHGRSPLAHVRQIRLGLARAALEESRLSVEQAAALAGYGSAANFSTAFRRAFGTAPSQVTRLKPPYQT